MPRLAAKTSAASAAILVHDGPPPPKPIDGIAGDAASPAALAHLEKAIVELKTLSAMPILRRALAELHANNPKAASDWALKALAKNARSGMGWYLLAVARENLGDFASSVKAYESALALLPDQVEVANNLGRLAFRMGMKEVAEQLFRRYLQAYPDSHEAANNLANAVRDLNRPAEAIEILRPAIKAHPDKPLLWNTLGTVLSEHGDVAGSLTFFDEALRLDPRFFQARHNRANAHVVLGQLEEALADCAVAQDGAASEEEVLMMQLSRSTLKVSLGRLGEGWDDYEARLAPRYPDVTHFTVDRPNWTPEAPLGGRTLLLMGEQGLGDEVLFANMIPDVLDALGPNGKLLLAVEPRLAPLFQRSFPTAEVGGHITGTVGGRLFRSPPFGKQMDRVDCWAALASPLRRFRRDLAAFPVRERFLVADPERVAWWRRALGDAPPGLKVGVLWKSMKIDGPRGRYFSPFQLWAPVLKTPGATFVNVQYGDCDAELAWAARELGVEFWRPPGIDLKNDLDDVAALTCALDLTIGFANATSNIAAACGAPSWFISTPGAWPRLGTHTMPWYPQVRVFLPPAYGQWEPVMAEVADALGDLARGAEQSEAGAR